MSGVENKKGVNKRTKVQIADLLFIAPFLASIGVITYGIILSKQTYANLLS